jgi:hypothetical protein
MKSFLLAVVFFVAGFSAVASDMTPQNDQGQTQPLLCTPDVNAWGHPSDCVCAESYIYDQTIGMCVR